eukprot:TRINITY_DN5024_c0_g1_i4.p1 TRINITY_DN5024_c0_g1~~TRINITY_DN5024_c0_g1_i4.p1  ORF type:complete len:298 (-),score=68.61 TRINITY_DN5024_c0_g1_i4:243-1067(-)
MATPVVLHIYDVTGHDAITGVNKALKLIGTGAFHGGVEVYGTEWSFGYCEDGSGVFSCPPRGCDAHSFRQSVDMGATALTEAQVNGLIQRMTAEWPGTGYDLLRRNCCTFSDTLCVELGVGHAPAWVNNLAGAGATLDDGFQAAHTKAKLAAIMAAAKAGEIDEQYNVSSTAQAKARDVLEATKALDGKYKVTATAQAAAITAGYAAASAAKTAGAKLVELDKQHGVSDKARQLDEQHQVTSKVGQAANAAVAGIGSLFSKLSVGSSSVSVPKK